MKKILSLMMAIAIIASFAACSGNKTDNPQEESVMSDSAVAEPNADSDALTPEDDKAEADGSSETQKPGNTQNEENKPTNSTKPNETEKNPVLETKPETKPEEAPQAAATTIGTKLLADFQKKAADSSKNAQTIAEELLSNPIIQFDGAVMPVEPGYLTGFDNTEITGFKEGVMFAPMIGTIPFVGYVFTLENTADASSFIASLKACANPRWNICTSAEETVVGSVGNKVFFVMCPKSFEE